MEQLKFTVNEHAHYSNYPGEKKFSSPEEEHEWSKTQLRTCNKCHMDLDHTQFGFNTCGSEAFDMNGYRRRRPDCKNCNKESNRGKDDAKKIAKKLGLPTKAPEGTCCELCGSTQKIVFDHDHESCTFRGWLCDPCNRSLGVLGDDVPSLVKAINYLNKLTKRKIDWNDSTEELVVE